MHQAAQHPIFTGVPDNTHFYFVNSYYPVPAQREVVIATAEHGVKFAAAIARDNMLGVQFHPEKSQTMGLKLLANFLAWRP